MKLEAVLALHPGPDADSATFSVALAAAETKRAELLREAADAEQQRRDGLLSADDKALAATGKIAETARLAADRIEAMLPQLKADLAAARGRETVLELQGLARTVEQRVAAMQEWQSTAYPELSRLIGAGLHAEHEAITAYAEFVARVDTEFVRQEVRDAAPTGLHVSAPSGARPSHLFPNWDRAHG